VSFKDENRNFIGKDALLTEKNKGISHQLIGLVLESKGVLRNHQAVKVAGDGVGEITSGSFSPTLNKSIALARIPVSDATNAFVERRGEWLPVKIVKPKFI
jgi:aminomethyltransferase